MEKTQKTVYYISIKKNVNGYKELYSSHWYYGVLPEPTIERYTWEEASAVCGSPFLRRTGLFSKKALISAGWQTPFISEKKFKYATVTRTPKEINYTYSIKELARELSAENFIDWCKDNGFPKSSLISP